MCVVRRLEGESYKMPAECDSMEISGQALHTGPGMKLFQWFNCRVTALCDTFITCSLSVALQLSQHASLFLCLCSVLMETAFHYLGNPAIAWLFMSAPHPTPPFYFRASLPYGPTSSLKNPASGCSAKLQDDGLLMLMLSFSCRSSFSLPPPVYRR